MTPEQRKLLEDVQGYAKMAATTHALMEYVAKHLHEKMTRYNWTGFYLVDPADSGFLIVGPYAGSFTPNTRIPLSKGLCGLAATSGKVVVVQDVTKDPNYLAGSSMVKSEIVVPIFAKKKLAGELDVESYFAETFTKREQEFIETCANVVAKYMESA
jgi:L-methionine (R)-S-oxide reductase